MKRPSFFSIILPAAFIILLASCRSVKNIISCCQGYAGPLSNSQSINLQNTDHFITADSISAWVTRLKSSSDSLLKANATDSNRYLINSHSFNRCIIKAFICNDSCIGLRVLQGMSADKKIHVILVGIKPDYTNLYIANPNCFPAANNTLLPRTLTSTVIDLGGDENSLNP